MSFAGDMKAFADKSKANMELATRLTMMKILNSLNYRSPVGDASYWKSKPPAGYAGGHFRANWSYGFNNSPTAEINDVDPTGEKAKARVQAQVTGQAGIHYLANNVPYAQRIEDGWSRQAPAGVVGLTVIEFKGIVDIVASGIKK